MLLQPFLATDHADRGGDGSAVQCQLNTVQQIQAAAQAFAAILDDGSVVTWGGTLDGGDSRDVQDQLKTVQHICICLQVVKLLCGLGKAVLVHHPSP